MNKIIIHHVIWFHKLLYGPQNGCLFYHFPFSIFKLSSVICFICFICFYMFFLSQIYKTSRTKISNIQNFIQSWIFWISSIIQIYPKISKFIQKYPKNIQIYPKWMFLDIIPCMLLDKLYNIKCMVIEWTKVWKKVWNKSTRKKIVLSHFWLFLREDI